MTNSNHQSFLHSDATNSDVGVLPVLGIVGWSGAGKTTLIEVLIRMLGSRGLHSAVIKHTHHSVDVDTPGKDSYRFREAGAVPVILASSSRWAMMVEKQVPEEPDLTSLVAQLIPLKPDIVLVEGFKHAPIDKLEVHRPDLSKPLICLQDSSINALATPGNSITANGIRSFDLDDPQEIVDWILGDILRVVG